MSKSMPVKKPMPRRLLAMRSPPSPSPPAAMAARRGYNDPAAPPLPRAFYARDAKTVARELVGKIIVHRVGGRVLRARIVETEAYVGAHDLACHASKGRTARTEVMFGLAGHAYVYLVYGLHDMFNIVTGAMGDAQAVLIRAAEPLDGAADDLSGPGKFARAMKITRADNNADLCGEKLFLLDSPHKPRLIVTPRIGVDYAGAWKDKPLRFFDRASAAVSKGNRTPRR
jgi:DNA-3-methyladenine glycosylase